MIRFFIISLFIVLLAISNIVTTSYVAIAASYPSADEKYNLDIDTAFNNRSKALIVQSKAYYNEVVRRPESVLNMSCFSESMNSFAQLGRQFSDVKFNISGLFSGNPLCSAVTMGMDSSLEGDLQAFFKLPGITLPSAEICSPDFDLAGTLSSKIAALLTFMPSFENLADGKNILGCPINIGLDLSGAATLSPMCVKVKLPSISCDAMTQLFVSGGNELLKTLTGGAVDLTKGVNTGWAYLTMTDQGNIGAGVDVKMSDVVTAISYTNPAFASALKEVSDKIEEIKSWHENYLKVIGGGTISVGVDLGAGVKTQGSGDGLTSDTGFSVEAGSRFSAGTGQEFAYQISEANGALQDELKKDIEALQKGPGDPDGLAVWKPIVDVNETITLKDIFDYLSDSGP